MNGYGILKRKLGQRLQVGQNRVVQASDGERYKRVFVLSTVYEAWLNIDALQVLPPCRIFVIFNMRHCL